MGLEGVNAINCTIVQDDNEPLDEWGPTHGPCPLCPVAPETAQEAVRGLNHVQ